MINKTSNLDLDYISVFSDKIHELGKPNPFLPVLMAKIPTYEEFFKDDKVILKKAEASFFKNSLDRVVNTYNSYLSVDRMITGIINFNHIKVYKILVPNNKHS